jgi:hypothetical protein
LRLGLGGTLLIALLLRPAGARAEDDTACQAAYVAGQRRYKLDHDLLGGRAELLTCAKACPDELRASCGVWLREIETELPSIVVRAKDSAGHDVLDGSLEIDGKAVPGYLDGTPIELNPGEHTLRVLRPNHPATGESVLLHAGEKLRVVDVWTEPQTTRVAVTRRPIPLASIVFAGVGAAALASFGAFAIWTTVEYDATSSCHPCNPSTRDPSFTAKTVIADVSLGVAGASLIAATAFFLARPTVTEQAPKTGIVTPWATRGGGGVAWSASF